MRAIKIGQAQETIDSEIVRDRGCRGEPTNWFNSWKYQSALKLYLLNQNWSFKGSFINHGEQGGGVPFLIAFSIRAIKVKRSNRWAMKSSFIYYIITHGVMQGGGGGRGGVWVWKSESPKVRKCNFDGAGSSIVIPWLEGGGRWGPWNCH